MGQKLLQQDPFIDLRRGSYFDDDFFWFSSGNQWTDALTNSSAPTVSSTIQDGVLVMVNTGATNDACFIYTTDKIALWSATSNPGGTAQPCSGITLMGECLIQFSEASTNNANIWFGFSSVVTVSQLVNASAGPATSFTGAGLYKQGGSLGWKTVSSQSTTQNLNTVGNFTAAAQTGYQRLRVQCEIVNGIMEITYFIDNGGGMQQCTYSSSSARPGTNLIKDYIPLSSPAAMSFGIGVKNGTSAAETLNVDYMASWKLRNNFLGSN